MHIGFKTFRKVLYTWLLFPSNAYNISVKSAGQVMSWYGMDGGCWKCLWNGARSNYRLDKVAKKCIREALTHTQELFLPCKVHNMDFIELVLSMYDCRHFPLHLLGLNQSASHTPPRGGWRGRGGMQQWAWMLASSDQGIWADFLEQFWTVEEHTDPLNPRGKL